MSGTGAGFTSPFSQKLETGLYSRGIVESVPLSRFIRPKIIARFRFYFPA